MSVVSAKIATTFCSISSFSKTSKTHDVKSSAVSMPKFTNSNTLTETPVDEIPYNYRNHLEVWMARGSSHNWNKSCFFHCYFHSKQGNHICDDLFCFRLWERKLFVKQRFNYFHGLETLVVHNCMEHKWSFLCWKLFLWVWNYFRI